MKSEVSKENRQKKLSKLKILNEIVYITSKIESREYSHMDISVTIEASGYMFKDIAMMA